MEVWQFHCDGTKCFVLLRDPDLSNSYLAKLDWKDGDVYWVKDLRSLDTTSNGGVPPVVSRLDVGADQVVLWTTVAGWSSVFVFTEPEGTTSVYYNEDILRTLVE